MNTINRFLMVFAGSCLLAPLVANAGIISADFEGNDCSGFFGTGFDACQIFGYDENERIEISPVIAKFGDDSEVNDTKFPTASLNDFDVTGFGENVSDDSDNESLGHWNISGSFDPTFDPGVRYWAAKGGNNFRLFWQIDDNDENASACDTDPFNLTCLNLAQVVTGGNWDTSGLGGKDPAISHLTLYNSEPPRMVPEPASLLLFGIGMFALGFIRRQNVHS